MARRVNIFGQPLAYDVGVEYNGTVPVPRSRPINPEGDDVSQVTKKTVVKYTEDLTHGVEGNRGNANAYPVGGEATVIAVSTTDGTTPALSTASNPEGQFAPAFSTAGRILETYSDSSQVALSGGEPALERAGDASFVKKGKSKGGEVDGHKLLSDQNANPDPRVQTRYVSPVLSNNRFSPEKPMSSVTGHEKKFNPDHPKEGFGSNKRWVKAGTDMTDGQVANVGPMLTLRATKELNSISQTGYGQDGPDGVGAKAASLLPGLAQVGAARVQTSDLEVESVLRALIAGDTEGVNVNDGEDGPRKVLALNTSYGQMNNVLEQFSGLLPLGMVAAGAALAIALNVAIRAVLAVFLLITNASSANSQKRDDVGRFIPGDSRFNPAFQKMSFPPVPLPAKLFGLVETVNPYGDAVNAGIKAFFGGDIGGSLQRVLETPGFYVTFSRNIVRSAADLARLLEDVGRGNPIQIAENIIAFVEAIKASKVVAVMNMFAQIGDVSLNADARLNRYTRDEHRTNDSEIDNLEGLNAMRNRKPGSLALAWGAGTTRTALLLPSTVKSAMLAGKPTTLTTLLSQPGIEYYDGNRLSAEWLEMVENELDGEYVPFYFHDLRTNEVVSFHAFLSNLTEDYSANYDNIDGYGRVDTVKMYRSTSRRLGLTFFVAATNHDDFDAMWVKINKLVTLVYPQWSKGTLLRDSDGNHFVQPFSQVPSASPLVRVRVGDLWKTNYSKFNLARVFGLGSADTFKLKEAIYDADSTMAALDRDAGAVLDQIRNNNNELKIGSRWLLEPGDYDAATEEQGAIGAAVGALKSIANSVGVDTGTNARVTARIRIPARVVVSKALNPSAYVVELLDTEGLPDAVASSKFLVSRSHLSISEETLFTYNVRESRREDDPLEQNDKVEKIQSLAQFFSSENNALVKAFEASKGRGLACVVEGLNFDWNDVPWETAYADSRAPKMCKVTMQLSVVHDIAPGIDSQGFNRAPVYSVGRSSNAMGGNTVNENKQTDLFSNLNKARKSLI